MGRRKEKVGKGGVSKEDQGQDSKLTAGTLYNNSRSNTTGNVTARGAAAKRRRADSEEGKAPEDHEDLTAAEVLLHEESGVVSKEGDLVSPAADLSGVKLEGYLVGGADDGVLKEGNLGCTELEGEGEGISLVYTSVAERVKKGRRRGNDNKYPTNNNNNYNNNNNNNNNNNVAAVSASVSVEEGDNNKRSSEVEEEEEAFAGEGESKGEKKGEPSGIEEENMELLENNVEGDNSSRVEEGEGSAGEGESKGEKRVELSGIGEQNMELLEDNGEEDVAKNEFEENGELGEKGLNLENGNEEGVEEERRENEEGKVSDVGEEGKGDCDGRRRYASRRKSSVEARLKMVRMNLEEEEEELVEGEKSRRKRRRGPKGKKEVGGESEGHGEEVNGENKKRRRGRKPSKAVVEKEGEENGGSGGELMLGEEKERGETVENKGGKRWRKTKGEGDREEGKEEKEEASKMSRDARYSLRAKKLVTGEAAKPKRVLKDENGILIESNMCHQCQRNDKGKVIRCTVCKTKRYCLPCVETWYEILVADK